MLGSLVVAVLMLLLAALVFASSCDAGLSCDRCVLLFGVRGRPLAVV